MATNRLPEKCEPTTHAELWLEKGLVASAGVNNTGDAESPFNDAKVKLILGVAGDDHQGQPGVREPQGYKAAFALRNAALKQVSPTERHVAQFVVVADGRIALGLGHKSARETGLTLHRTWGTPLLPGDAIKAVARRAADRLFGGEWTWGSAAHRALFGNEPGTVEDSDNERGLVCFHDAWWLPDQNRSLVDLDVLTSHHPDYYGSGPDRKIPAPSDTDDPNPVSFATVGGKFLVILEGPSAEWVEAAKDFVLAGLDEIGIGSKTNAGYGRLTAVDAVVTHQDRNATATTPVPVAPGAPHSAPSARGPAATQTRTLRHGEGSIRLEFDAGGPALVTPKPTPARRRYKLEDLCAIARVEFDATHLDDKAARKRIVAAVFAAIEVEVAGAGGSWEITDVRPRKS